MSLSKNEKLINEETFTNLNSESAYLLGFIYADGFLGFHKHTGQHYLRIYSKQKYKIENARQIFRSTTPIVHIPEKINENTKQGELFYLHVGNQTIIEDLIDLGMVERKNNAIKFPYLTEDLYPHFIRGAWAGKGCVSNSNGAIFSYFTIGSIDFISSLERHLRSQGLSKQTILANKRSKKPSYRIRYSVADTKKLYEYLYADYGEFTICNEQEKLLRDFFSSYQFTAPSLKRTMKRLK